MIVQQVYYLYCFIFRTAPKNTLMFLYRVIIRIMCETQPIY